MTPVRAAERDLVDEALDPEVMGSRLRSALRRADAGACVVLDAKYEAGSYCTVQYRLGDERVTAMLTFAGPQPDGGVEVATGARAFVFPDDPRITGLPAVMQGDVVAAVLGADSARVTLVRYRAGKRATVRIEADDTCVFAKVYATVDKAAAVHAEGQRLASVLASAPLTVAPVRTAILEVPMVLWDPVDGTDLEPALDGPRAGELVAAVAGGLAGLHGAPPVSDRVRSVDAELRRFGQRAARAAQVAPDTGTPLVDLAAAVAAASATVERAAAGLVHGDCKPSQFLVTADGVALLDFDHCGLADPASDVGTFMASLRQRGRAALAPALLDAYCAATGGDAGLRRRAQWYEAVALTRKALRAFARDPRSPIPGILVAAGFECLERLQP